jgi:O-antigen chain-terminating methyltransferase
MRKVVSSSALAPACVRGDSGRPLDYEGMIETTIPEINVSELMERVRAKVEELRQAQVRPQLPLLATINQIATAILPKPVTPKTEKILRATQVAREATMVNRWIPKPLRGLFRRQDKFNREVLRAIELLSNTNAQLADRVRHLIACVEVQDQGMQHLADVRRADAEWMNEVARTRASDAGWRQGAERLLSSLAGHRRKALDAANKLAERVAAIEMAMESVSREANELKHQFGTTDGRLDTLGHQSEALRDQIASLEEAIRAIALDLQREAASRSEKERHVGEQLEGERAQRAAIRHDLESLEQRQTSDSAFIKAELSRQSELVHKLIDRISLGTKTKSKRAADGELSELDAHHLDAFYFSFENRFRGPREEIKRRMQFYLPLVEGCGAGKRSRPIVDLGCGRGEWLELLKQQKLTATGVDVNQAMIDQCKERRLDVVQADAIEFLRQLPDDSQGAITGFHIIEHLPLDTLIALISETLRVLQPGGLAIFESPNCKNLTVGASYFYIDPTHRNPVFPETAQFMLETTGFERVTLEYLSPVETTGISDIDEQPVYLRELLYGPRDFGVIGYKPADQHIKRVAKPR